MKDRCLSFLGSSVASVGERRRLGGDPIEVPLDWQFHISKEGQLQREKNQFSVASPENPPTALQLLAVKGEETERGQGERKNGNQLFSVLIPAADFNSPSPYVAHRLGS